MHRYTAASQMQGSRRAVRRERGKARQVGQRRRRREGRCEGGGGLVVQFFFKKGCVSGAWVSFFWGGGGWGGRKGGANAANDPPAPSTLGHEVASAGRYLAGDEMAGFA